MRNNQGRSQEELGRAANHHHQIKGLRLVIRRIALAIAVVSFLIVVPGILGLMPFTDLNSLLNVLIVLVVSIFVARHG